MTKPDEYPSCDDPPPEESSDGDIDASPAFNGDCGLNSDCILKNQIKQEPTTATNELNQLDYLASLGLFPADLRSPTPMVNYTNESQPLDLRARAYLDINCAHCHNPNGWSRPADEGLDLHYEVPFTKTGISNELRALRRNVQSGEMPFLGTTLKHSEGIKLLLSYFDSL
jgi:hypothetical protein